MCIHTYIYQAGQKPASYTSCFFVLWTMLGIEHLNCLTRTHVHQRRTWKQAGTRLAFNFLHVLSQSLWLLRLNRLPPASEIRMKNGMVVYHPVFVYGEQWCWCMSIILHHTAYVYLCHDRQFFIKTAPHLCSHPFTSWFSPNVCFHKENTYYHHYSLLINVDHYSRSHYWMIYDYPC